MYKVGMAKVRITRDELLKRFDDMHDYIYNMLIDIAFADGTATYRNKAYDDDITAYNDMPYIGGMLSFDGEMVIIEVPFIENQDTHKKETDNYYTFTEQRISKLIEYLRG